MRVLLICVIACCVLGGCFDAQRAQYSAIGSKFRVTLYSGGEAIRSWESTGKVLTETDSDGWYFTDAKTGKLVRLSGDVVIEQE